MKKLVWLVIIVIVLGGLWWFGQNQTPATTDSETVKVGLLMPLTGPRADGGEYAKNGFTIAQEEISVDVNRRFKLQSIFEDSMYDPKVAVSGLTKLINLDGVKFIIGPHGSSEVLATAPVAEQNKIIMIAPAAQSDDISEAGDYIFRIIHNSAQEAPAFASFVAGHMSGEELPFLAINTAITDSYLNNFKPIFESFGKKVGVIEKFDSKATDFRTELLKIKVANPTEIFLIAAPSQSGLILKQANELGFQVKFYSLGVEGPELIETAGVLAEGLLYPYSYDGQSAESRVRGFYEKYLARFGVEPDTVAANAYDAAYLLSDCFERVGTEVELVKDCLYNVRDWSGAGGTFSINEKGDAIKTIFIKTIRDGQFVRLME